MEKMVGFAERRRQAWPFCGKRLLWVLTFLVVFSCQGPSQCMGEREEGVLAGLRSQLLYLCLLAAHTCSVPATDPSLTHHPLKIHLLSGQEMLVPVPREEGQALCSFFSFPPGNRFLLIMVTKGGLVKRTKAHVSIRFIQIHSSLLRLLLLSWESGS